LPPPGTERDAASIGSRVAPVGTAGDPVVGTAGDPVVDKGGFLLRHRFEPAWRATPFPPRRRLAEREPPDMMLGILSL
jgi:hypothetical protein